LTEFAYGEKSKQIDLSKLSTGIYSIILNEIGQSKFIIE